MASVCYILNVVLVAVIVSAAVQCYVMTENQIMADIKFLSQTSDGVKPSRLREFLLADLRQALPKVQLCTDKSVLLLNVFPPLYIYTINEEKNKRYN